VLANKWDDPTFISYRDAFPETARSSPEAFEAHVKDLTQRDVKIAYLKNLQGKMSFSLSRKERVFQLEVTHARKSFVLNGTRLSLGRRL
jgi:hypothetical protein